MTEKLLCEYCGKMFSDELQHLACSCDKMQDLQDQFWQRLIDEFDINISVYMFAVDDETFSTWCRYRSEY